jgi:hypothetical protein
MVTFVLISFIALFGTMGTFLSIEAKRRNSAQSTSAQDARSAMARAISEKN